MRSKQNILIVDDDQAIAELLQEILEDEGFNTVVTHSAADALCALDSNKLDLAILDIMMPEMNGFELCEAIRARCEIPLIFLSAKNESIDKVLGLTLGADDYITKPFEIHELIARVKANLRRYTLSSEPKQKDHILTNQNIVLNLTQHTCHINDIPISLTRKEFLLLQILMEDPMQPHSVQKLFETIWETPYDRSGGNSVMVHMRRLRKKLATADCSHTYITTVWGVGYKMG